MNFLMARGVEKRSAASLETTTAGRDTQEKYSRKKYSVNPEPCFISQML